jgi:potassium efflux system protein
MQLMSIGFFKFTASRLLAAVAAAILFFVVVGQAPAFAQGGDPGLIASQQQLIGDLGTQVTELEKKVLANGENDAVLLAIRLELEDVARELLEAGVAFRPRLNEINARLESLGPPPAEGQPAEAEIVVNERQSLANEKSQINVLIGDAESASIRANKLIDPDRARCAAIYSPARFQSATTSTTRLLGEVAAEFRAEMSALYLSFPPG